METPSELRSVADEQPDVTISRREYDEESVIAVDFGAGNHPTVDVVGDTAIVVIGDHQFEFKLPAEATDVTVNDGILSITDAPAESADAESETTESEG